MADTATPTGKPDLKTTHARLRALNQYLLEVLARARAAGLPTVTFKVEGVETQAQTVTRAVMDLEANLA